MAVYVLDNSPDAVSIDDIVEELGLELSNRYLEAENELLRAAADRTARILALEASVDQLPVGWLDRQQALRDLDLERAKALRELQTIARRIVERLADGDFVEQVIDTAVRYGTQEAARQLGLAARLPVGSTLTGTAAQSIAALTLDLSNRLETLNARILRYPQDVYQRVIASTSTRVLLGAQTSRVSQAAAVRRFFDEGVTAFTDRAGRTWRIGTYSQMATRTAVNRAFNDAGINRMQQSGVNLITITGAADACSKCAPWIGKILSTDGTTGTVTLPHATEPGDVTIVIDGTLQQARNSGWGHPNDRCKCVAHLAGLPTPQQGFEHDPDAEAARETQREIERRIRKYKRAESTATDDVAKARAKQKRVAAQKEMREHIARTGRKRDSGREQLHFTDSN